VQGQLVLKGFLPYSGYLHEDERYKNALSATGISAVIGKKMLTAILVYRSSR
jgi:hypothetical protein